MDTFLFLTWVLHLKCILNHLQYNIHIFPCSYRALDREVNGYFIRIETYCEFSSFNKGPPAFGAFLLEDRDVLYAFRQHLQLTGFRRFSTMWKPMQVQLHRACEEQKIQKQDMAFW